MSATGKKKCISQPISHVFYARQLSWSLVCHQVNYNHSFLDKKEFNYSAKKRLESTMSAKITGSISLLAPGTLVEVL